MDHQMLFHRSFWDVTDRATTKHNMWIGEQTYERVPVYGSEHGYKWLPKALRPIELIAKPNQAFRSYATGWEERCSILLTNSGQFYPVVDQQETPSGLLVVGHYGEAAGNRIVVQRQYVKPNSASESSWLGKVLDQGAEAYVVSQNYPDAGAWAPLQSYFWRYMVVTDLEGKVLANLGGHGPDQSIESIDPFIYLGIGTLLVGLGTAVGKRLIRTMIRRAAQRRLAAGKIPLPEGSLRHAVVSREGQILAEHGDTAIPHSEFVRRAVRTPPPGAWVGSFGKHKGKIEAITSSSFGRAMPAPQWVMDAILRIYQ
jgi:hypothetical protein